MLLFLVGKVHQDRTRNPTCPGAANLGSKLQAAPFQQVQGTMAGAVPETVLKKRKRDEEWATKKAAQQAEARSKAKETRKEIFKRAEQYVKEYRAKVRLLALLHWQGLHLPWRP